MNTGTLVGLVLVLAAGLDLVLAFVVVGPRLPAQSRRAVQLSLVIGAVLILTLGVLFLSGALGPGGSASA